MPKNKSYKVNRKRASKGRNLLSVLLLLVAALVISLLIALVWQSIDDNKEAAGSSSASTSQVAAPSSSEPVASATHVSEPASSSEPKPPEKPKPPEGALQETDRVNSSYFDDAVFVGDSVTEGMLYCIGMQNARILAGTSINFSTIYTTEVIKLADGTRTTIMDELGNTSYNKVYIMLGGNEVRDDSKENFIKRYGKVLDDIKLKQPDAIYYVQSMTPVTTNNNYNMSNTRIDDFNEAVMQLAKEKGMYYLNVAESMKDANGALPNEASPGDGMHFGQPYFDKWYAYLKTHTAPDSATPSQLTPESSASVSSSSVASSSSTASSTPSSSTASTEINGKPPASSGQTQ